MLYWGSLGFTCVFTTLCTCEKVITSPRLSRIPPRKPLLPSHHLKTSDDSMSGEMFQRALIPTVCTAGGIVPRKPHPHAPELARAGFRGFDIPVPGIRGRFLPLIPSLAHTLKWKGGGGV